MVKHLNGPIKHVGSSSLEIFRTCLGIALNKLLKLGLVFFMKKLNTSALWDIPTCNGLLSCNGFLVLYVFNAECYQNNFYLNSSIAISKCHRQIPQQHREQSWAGLTQVLPLSLFAMHCESGSLYYLKKHIHEWYMGLEREKSQMNA